MNLTNYLPNEFSYCPFNGDCKREGMLNVCTCHHSLYRDPYKAITVNMACMAIHCNLSNSEAHGKLNETNCVFTF